MKSLSQFDLTRCRSEYPRTRPDVLKWVVNERGSNTWRTQGTLSGRSTLDRSETRVSILIMKVVILFSLVLAMCAGRALAQQGNVSIGTTNAPMHTFEPAVSPPLNADLRNAELRNQRSEVSLGKELHARGPLIHLFHTRKPGEVPKRFWQLINPFSRSEGQPEAELPRARDLSPRAWTSVAGWHPGVSSYANSLTSPEGGQGIGLVSIEH